MRGRERSRRSKTSAFLTASRCAGCSRRPSPGARTVSTVIGRGWVGVEVPEPRSEAVERELSVLIGGVAVGDPATAFVRAGAGRGPTGKERSSRRPPPAPKSRSSNPGWRRSPCAGAPFAVAERVRRCKEWSRRTLHRGRTIGGDFIECEAPEREAFHGSGAPCRSDAPGRNGTARGNGQKPRLP